jgi:segregation and condensation protein A
LSSRPARSWEVSLPQYEGPLDLLVELVSREELDVKTLPIARLTQQFLAYVKQANSFDLDLGTEWALMAATLIYLKSYRLLPQKNQEDTTGETETGNLVRDLIERDNLRRLGSHLGWQWAGSGQWPAPEPVVEPEPGPSQERGPAPLNALDIAFLAQRPSKSRLHPPLESLGESPDA